MIFKIVLVVIGFFAATLVCGLGRYGRPLGKTSHAIRPNQRTEWI